MKTIFTSIFSLFIVIWISAFSCHDDLYAPPDIQNASGIVLDFGNPAVDGCGYLIKVDTILYAPAVLDSSFKKDSLEVFLDFNVLTTTWNCGWRPSGYTQIDVKTITIKK